ncbi:Superoxide dismutase [Mn], mitochondrial, variant 2 [Orbilia oligospora]|nr:Superoxide dismutase [Mn], mitochondrial [Orbilia oligospora]KAF3181584.1 Superoxide dismutase [Mn], mitochondrial, variant 2 [Orbilia oligospora]KAF3253315.1 Superoxide dismutase [Mn], mitochondrial [Orbilia oligospora]KAF3255102.1 Superoxide dismutase [Mn], mitochondrial [Orbilia oligospora]KAF3255103.1 Superoxide dismutase [Mn], mitochondrial, variant 2 [Orbilia oligospora]
MKSFLLVTFLASACAAQYGQSLDDLPKIVDNSTATSSPEKYILPPLPYEYDALEPHISAQIMKLHHQAHHQAYVDNLNKALAELKEVQVKEDMAAKDRIEALEETIHFNRGGHINHSLFWKGLAPAGSPETHPQGGLERAIVAKWGSVDGLSAALFRTILGRVRGSGWGWIVCNVDTRELSFATTRDQDPISLPQLVILGIDMWEHAYYLQYYNKKQSYLKAIWTVLNWKEADERYASCLKHTTTSS